MSEIFIKKSLSAVYFNSVIMDYKRGSASHLQTKHFQTGIIIVR